MYATRAGPKSCTTTALSGRKSQKSSCLTSWQHSHSPHLAFYLGFGV